MPLCFCYTSLNDTDIPSGFEDRLSTCVSEVLSKPVERISVIMNSGSRICKGGISTEPAFILQIRSIAVFDEKRNPDYFPKFFEFLTNELNISANRMTIEFVDIQGYNAMSGK